MDKQWMSKFFGRKTTLLKMFKKSQIFNPGTEQRYVYVDNKAPVLLVAHIDTVQKPELRRYNTGAGFDDRLGCFVGWTLVNQYPQYFDLLLTDFEETGGTTSRFFSESHDYNFVIELDREGGGYVDYELASDEMKKLLLTFGLEETWGTYSDICEMDYLDCAKINLGLGTYNGHSINSGFDEYLCELQIEKILKFVELYSDKYFEMPEQRAYDMYRFYDPRKPWKLDYKYDEDNDLGKYGDDFSKTEQEILDEWYEEYYRQYNDGYELDNYNGRCFTD